MTTKIVVRERQDDYMAFVEGHLEIWGCGERVSQAIRDLVISHNLGCDLEIRYETDSTDIEKLKIDIQEMEQRKKQKTEQKVEERLKIGQEIICPKHGSQTIEAIDDSVPQDVFYVLSCGCLGPIDKEEVKKPIGRRKGPYSNWG